MLKNLVWWFIVWGLSFLLASACGCSQGIVFLIFYLIASSWQLGLEIISTLCLGILDGNLADAVSISIPYLLVVCFIIVLPLLLCFIVSKLFGFDFYLTYQIVTLLLSFFSFKVSFHFSAM